MYKIEKTEYGLKLIFEGLILADQMESWLKESEEYLSDRNKSFGVFVDMRKLKPIPKSSQRLISEGQKLYKTRGMERSAVILKNTVLTRQFKTIAKETGIFQLERYIDASKNDDWEQQGLKWLLDSVEPE